MNHQTSTVPQVIPQVAYQSPQAPTQLVTESPFIDSGFVVLVFSPGDDLIACLNKAMDFLMDLTSSRLEPNNQLRTSSNPRNQATIQDGRVTGQQARVVKCYNCQGEGHMARQCTQPKRPRNAAWYKEKAMFVEAQEAGQILDEEQLVFLADPGIPASQAQTVIPHNAAFQTEDLDTYDSDCDDLSTAQADFEQSLVMDFTDNEISSDSNIIPYSQYLQETQHATVQDTNLQKISHKPVDYEKLNSLIDDFGKRFSPQQEFSAEQAFWFHILNPTIEPSYSPPVIVEVPSELPKVSLVNASLKKLKFHLTQFDSVVKKRTTPSALEEGEWGFEHTKAVFNKEIIPFLKSLKDIFNVFDKDLLNEITEVQTVFDQMEASVQQFSVDKKCLEIAKKEILLENDRLLQKIMSQDVMLTVINSMSWNNDSVNMKTQMCDSCEKCMNLDAELSKSKQAYNDLLKNHSQLEKHCISLEVSMQLKQEVFQNDESCVNQNAVEIQEYFEINDLKARLQDKDTTISKLKDNIKSLKKNTKEKNVHHEKCDLEPINEELENSVEKLLSENEQLWNEINHVKQVIQIVLWYLDSGCSKHMTGNRSGLMNFVSKFLGTVRFGNDQIARIMGYGDYQHGNVIISRVYYIEGLGHNLFSVGQFCDVDLQVAFQKNTCFIRNLEGVDLLSGSRDTNLDHEDLGKFDAKADIGIFVGYAPAKKAFRIYNKRTHIITETIHVSCDELTTMASEQFSSGPGLQGMTPATSSTGLGLNPISQLPCLPPKEMIGI
ncbi:integrase, catalytic region, zinc finger, CCHC-type containing protein [Tanacetum coccineum]